MKRGLRMFALVGLTLVIQHMLGHPRTATLATALLLPMPWLIGPPLLGIDRRWYWISFPLGLGWDLFFEPVIGVGAIAWSAAALLAWIGASVITERKVKAWFAFGAGGTVAFWLTRTVCFVPLDLKGNVTWTWIGVSALVTGLWCVSVLGVITLDLPSIWRQRRARRLR